MEKDQYIIDYDSNVDWIKNIEGMIEMHETSLKINNHFYDKIKKERQNLIEKYDTDYVTAAAFSILEYVLFRIREEKSIIYKLKLKIYKPQFIF